MKHAVILNANATERQVAAYLPRGWEVYRSAENFIMIRGEEVAGWTLDGYILPRLSSGLITAKEVRLGERPIRDESGFIVVVPARSRA
jgi:hypothetical protein